MYFILNENATDAYAINTNKGEKTMEKEKIDEILNSHKEWLDTNGKKGKQADFSYANLHGVDFSRLDLSDANFAGATLIETDFHKADLSNANFNHADLSNADLSEANLSGANLRRAIFTDADLRKVNLHRTKILKAFLRGAFLPDEIYMIEGAGSRHRCTYYDTINDFVKCGCWDDDAGNHLESFKKRVEGTYGKNGKTPNQKHYKAYQAVINYFEVCRDEYTK